MSRLLPSLLLLAACRPNLLGYWEITSWEVTRPDGVELATDDVGWVEYDDQGNVLILTRYDFRGGDAFVPLVDTEVQASIYDRLERDQPHLLPGFSGMMRPQSATALRIRYEDAEEPFPLVFTATGEAVQGYTSSYVLERP